MGPNSPKRVREIDVEGVVAGPEELSLRERAEQVLPGGGFGNVSMDVIIREGRGARVWDVSGNEYVDYLIGSGPMLIGHGHPEVLEAVQEQVKRGTTFFANNEFGIELAEEIVEAVACAEQVRYVSTGTEATLYAMRVARAYRRREKILKFEGGYHGMNDYALMSMAPKRLGNFPQAEPDSAGIPNSAREDVLVAPFNDLETAVSLIRENAEQLGGVIVEPMQRLIPPAEGFLQGLRDVTSELGIPLIFDEVVTGFRLAFGGAQAYYGVTPDLCSMGKIIGGGFPLAAIAGRSEIMAHFDRNRVAEEDFTVQIGTLSGNPVAAVAGLATLKVLERPGQYERLFDNGRAVMAALGDSLGKLGIAHQIVGEPPMFDVVFTDTAVSDYRTIIKGDAARLAKFNTELRKRGILKGDSKYYVSVALEPLDLEQTAEAIEEAAKSL
jgi:glutamate-1-semialdehyde 2,1-aminomutase